jgi:hypothetical protein
MYIYTHIYIIYIYIYIYIYIHTYIKGLYLTFVRHSKFTNANVAAGQAKVFKSQLYGVLIFGMYLDPDICTGSLTFDIYLCQKTLV